MKRLFWDAICLAVVCIVLSLGLWPFHAPGNDVTWQGNSLRFHRFGTAFGAGAFQETSAESEASGSIEVWMQPRRIWDGGTFLAIFTPGHPYQFSLRQFDGGLILQTEVRNDPRGAKKAILNVKDLFRRPGPVFLTITSGPQGTAVYADGVLAGSAPQVRFSAQELTGRLVIGDSPGQTHCWSGDLRGLAIYRSELGPARVLRHYQTWSQRGRPDVSGDERNLALYLFNERTGRIVHDYAGSGVDLIIPEKYVVLEQIFLEPFWKEFNLSRSYGDAALENIIGFVPFGFCFFVCLSAHHVKRPALTTVILGTLVSLTIEVLQAYLPTRDSGMTDLITNTFGTYIGVVTCNAVSPVLGGMLPRSLSAKTVYSAQ